MARVKFVDKEQADPIIKEMFQKLDDRKVPVLNLFKAVGNCPKIGRNFVRLGNSILNPEFIDPKLRELAILRVGNLLRSEYEFTKHVTIGTEAGITKDQINELSHRAIVKLTATIGYYGMVSRILVALQIELEPGEKAFIPKY